MAAIKNAQKVYAQEIFEGRVPNSELPRTQQDANDFLFLINEERIKRQLEFMIRDNIPNIVEPEYKKYVDSVINDALSNIHKIKTLKKELEAVRTNSS